MANSVEPHQPFRMVLYVDEIVPGNPFRPEKSRTLQCIYFAFLDWPQWLLQRTYAWPCFGVLRSKHVEFIPGRISGLMRKVLHLCFMNADHNMQQGVLLQRADQQLLVRANFAGFLADEKALKETFSLTGASGDVLTSLLQPHVAHV